MAIYSSVPPLEQAAVATVTLSIPLDAEIKSAKGEAKAREPTRRDSMKRRDALLKGKEGSRRRQRWENGELALPYPRPCPPPPASSSHEREI